MKKLFITMFIVVISYFVGDAVSAVTVPGCNIYCSQRSASASSTTYTLLCSTATSLLSSYEQILVVCLLHSHSLHVHSIRTVPTLIPEPVVDNCRISSFTSNRNYVTSGEAVTH